MDVVTYSKHYFTTALENMEKNRSKQPLPSQYITYQYIIHIQFVIFSSGERWRVQLIGEYPNYINAAFIPVRIMHFFNCC